MDPVLLVLDIGRERLMLTALGALIAAGVVVSVGAWVLLLRQRRRWPATRDDR